MSLSGDKVEMTGCGGPEGGGVRVVAHREALCVVPQRGDGVAVVVVHHQARLGYARWRAVEILGVLDELVHQSVVKRVLLGGVVVVLVAGQRLDETQRSRV